MGAPRRPPCKPYRDAARRRRFHRTFAKPIGQKDTNYNYRLRVSTSEIVDESTEDRAITPAVALVVMIAISIGLAAVLGFVLFGGGGGGGGGGQSGEPTANFTIEKTDDGGVSISIDDPGNTDEISFMTSCNGTAPDTITDPTEGTSVAVSGCASGDTVTVVGASGGTEKLLRRYEY